MVSNSAKIVKIGHTLLHVADRGVFALERAWQRAARHSGLPTSVPRMVLVTTDYPPIVSGGIYRTVGLVNAAKARRWKVEVVVPRVSHKGRSIDGYMELRGAVADRILDVPPPARELKRGWIRDVHGGFDQAMATYRAVHREPLAPPDVVLASGPSFLGFVAAYWLSLDWHCGLVLDYRDEWTTHSHQLFLRTPKFERQWERRCLEAAEWVTVTTAAQRDNLIERFGLQDRSDAFIVMPNGWDPEDCVSRADEPRSSGVIARPQIGYFGSLRKTTYIPAVVAALRDHKGAAEKAPQLHVYGDIRVADSALDAAVERGNILLHGNVPRSEVFALMTSMDVLLASFAAGLEDYMPGKLTDYLATDRPILFVGPDGEAAGLIRELGAGLCTNGEDANAIGEAIAELAAAPADRFVTPERLDWRRCNERGVLAARLLDRLETSLSAARASDR